MQFYKFDYAIRDAEGHVVDTSKDGEPLSFVTGDGTMIPGLEAALSGRSAGDRFSVTLGPEQAYGHKQRALTRTVSREMFDHDVESLAVGMILQMGSGRRREVAKIIAIDGDDVTVDANHPLAGITFNFDIEVIEARIATEDDMPDMSGLMPRQ